MIVNFEIRWIHFRLLQRHCQMDWLADCSSESKGWFSSYHWHLQALFPFTVTHPAFKPSVGSTLFFAIHAAAVAAFFVKPDLTCILLCAGLFVVRKFGITGGYHRYFSHRSFKTSRWFQFVLAFLGGMSAQKGALWWAAHHRHHHQHSDQEDDVHSVKQQGF